MKLLIAIPSKGRSDTIFKRTMRWACRLGYDVRVFCEPSEIEAYREAARDGNYQNRTAITDASFVDIGKNNGGLSYAKKFIKDYAIQNGYDLVFRLDDDVLRFSSRGRNKPDDLMIIKFSEMVGKCRVTFGKYPDVAAVGFGYRNELYEPKEWAGINMRLQTCYIIKPEYIAEGFGCFDDFADYVNIRKQNKVTLRYGLLGIDVADVGKTKGGLQMFDREELANQDIVKLRAMHPAIEFKIVRDKTWGIEPVMTGDFFGVKKL